MCADVLDCTRTEDLFVTSRTTRLRKFGGADVDAEKQEHASELTVEDLRMIAKAFGYFSIHELIHGLSHLDDRMTA